METLIEKKLNDILKKELKKFKSYMLEVDYEEFKDYPEDKMFSLYIYSIINNPVALKKIKNKSIKNNINPKKFNDFIYISMKYMYKQEHGIWSWFEADYFNIDIEEWKETTLTYTII
tara:strand:+ start:358 stop:708 length:351 start_codon:yes stop_codon:yes gene_type:complete